ncbi:MAG: sigma-54-dependent Fis family transcriptional regulator [Fibrobacteres bacterium]|nr:sigma-54-dependent Fis family transcriptional regulator [Fibrobacterota bacterium]
MGLIAIKEGDPAWRQISGRFIILTVDSEGRVQEVKSLGRLEEVSIIDRLIERKATLFDLFDLNGYNNLSELKIDHKTLFNSRPVYKYVRSTDSFKTDLPLFSLSIDRISDDLYLAVISPTRIISALASNPSLPTFFVDRQKRIRGFNESFASLAGINENDAIFNSNVDYLIFPWLDQLTLKRSEEEKKFKDDYMLLEQGVSERWLAKDPERNSLYKLFKAGNLKNRRIKITINAFLEKGSAPLFQAGSEQYADQLVCGPSAMRKDIAVVKKNGYIIWDGPFKSTVEKERYTWEWVIDNNFIEMKRSDVVNNFSYLDFEGDTTGDALLSIGLRDGTLLTDIEWSVEESASKIEDMQQIFRFTAFKDRAFLMHYLYHPVLVSSFPDVCAYGFREVTELESDKERFSKLYETEKKENAVLYSKLTKNGILTKEDFSGSSESIIRIKSKAEIAAASDVTILIEGETGTGKGALAAYIHKQSRFADKKMVTVDCSSIPASLIESELFGAEKGAFTGATERRIGKLEEADNTTLFLDEINSLPFPLQSRLLKFLEDYTVTRVGGTKGNRLNVRVIAASNRPLKSLVDESLFRMDLYYRLNTVALIIPPLRERESDIIDLSVSFLHQYCAKYKKELIGFDSRAIKKMTKYTWPGNVRELKNQIERAVLFCSGNLISDIDLEVGDLAQASKEFARKKFRLEISRENLEKVLKENSNNINKVSRFLNCSRSTLYYNMRKFSIQR